jgi:hypothetical protein
MDAEYPLEFESIKSSPLSAHKIVVSLKCRWVTRRRPSTDRAMLVVESEAGRHAVPAMSPPRRALRSRTWTGEFALPAWLQPSMEGSTSLALGEVTIPLPAGAFSQGGVVTDPAPAPPPRRGPPPEPEAVTDPLEAPEAPDAPPEPETVAALRAELDRRTASEAAARGELARVQADLGARFGEKARLDETHAELRAELNHLREAVDRLTEVESTAVVLGARVEDLEAELAAAHAEREQLTEELAGLRGDHATTTVACEAARSEASGLREELERFGAELADARRDASPPNHDLDQAQALLMEARALRAKMSERAAARASAVGDG